MNKRGTATVLAMIFMVVFAALACAFYAMVNTSMTVGKNDRSIGRSRAAAESGVEYVKHQVSRIVLPPNTPDSVVLSDLRDKLAAKLDTSPDRVLSSGTVTLDGNGTLVRLPELYLQPQNPLSKKYPQSFLGTITQMTYGTREDLLVGVEGQDRLSGLRRTIQAQFRSRPAGREIFNYDVVSRGPMSFRNGEVVGSGLSGATNVMSTSTAATSVDLSNSNINGAIAVAVSPSQVTGAPSGTNVVVADPLPFPEFDPNQFRPLTDPTLAPMTGTEVKTTTVYTNRVIGANQTPKFPSGSVINGILFIEPPNNVTFLGAVTLNGIIVFGEGFKSNGTRYGPTDCTMTMSGTFTFAQNLAAIPANPPGLADALAGYTIMAPYARIDVTGSADISAQGSIICDTFVMHSSGNSVNINNGTLLTLSTTASPSFDLGQGQISFSGSAIPPDKGIIYWRHYVMLPSADLQVDPNGVGYEEVNQ